LPLSSIGKVEAWGVKRQHMRKDMNNPIFLILLSPRYEYIDTKTEKRPKCTAKE